MSCVEGGGGSNAVRQAKSLTCRASPKFGHNVVVELGSGMISRRLSLPYNAEITFGRDVSPMV